MGILKVEFETHREPKNWTEISYPITGSSISFLVNELMSLEYMLMDRNNQISTLQAELKKYREAEKDGRMVVLDEETALSMAAGARAILNNKRLEGTKYAYDIFGEHKTISYFEAAIKLSAISKAALARQGEGEST